MSGSVLNGQILRFLPTTLYNRSFSIFQIDKLIKISRFLCIIYTQRRLNTSRYVTQFSVYTANLLSLFLFYFHMYQTTLRQIRYPPKKTLHSTVHVNNGHFDVPISEISLLPYASLKNIFTTFLHRYATDRTRKNRITWALKKYSKTAIE